MDAARSGAAALADYVRQWAPAAGYDLAAWGAQKRLADDSGLSPSTLSKLLKGERTPDAAALQGLAAALKRPLLELLVASGIIPPELLDHPQGTRVASRPITGDDLADEWGVSDPADRAYVRESIDRVRALVQRHTHRGEDGRAANG